MKITLVEAEDPREGFSIEYESSIVPQVGDTIVGIAFYDEQERVVTERTIRIQKPGDIDSILIWVSVKPHVCGGTLDHISSHTGVP